MSGKCIVPNCKNTIGTLFPKDQTRRQVWIETLDLKSVPQPESFICLEHFESYWINNDAPSGSKLHCKIKKGAIPTIKNPANKATKNEERTEQPTKHLSNKDIKICRTCMTQIDIGYSIFDYIEDEVTIMSVLMLCAFPLEIIKHDKLPKHICKECLTNLKSAHHFRNKCLSSNEILHEKFTKKRQITSDNENESCKKQKLIHIGRDSSDTDDKSYVVGTEDNRGRDIAALNLSEDDNNAFEVLYEDIDEVQENTSECDLLQKSNIEEGGDDPLEFVLAGNFQIKPEIRSLDQDLEESTEDKGANIETTSPRRKSQRITVAKDLGDKEQSFTPIKLQRQVISALDDIEKNMEKIHGRNTIEIERDVSPPAQETFTENNEEESENIISTLTEDSVQSRRIMIPSVRKSDYNFRVKSEQQPHPKKKIVVKTANLAKVKKEHVPSIVKLPKDIKIKAVEKYESTVGRFPCTLCTGVYDTIFIMADDYLFEYGLMKNNVRHLKCVVPNCGAHAEQKSVDDTFEDYLNVKIPHNHPAPNEAMRKKQMFLCIMRRKIQTDKTLNIRSLYEDVCLQDPQIRNLVPLRNVINEVCRHQLAQKVPPINTFEDFYKYIEKDFFEKLHFTHSNQQFYQEKFHAEDGGMAVVFANIDVIQQLSDSKIMYVDASFKIDTQEDFKYQLLTVLVWIDDSYYPIMFSLINKKTQEIFKLIFSYLYNVLAPQLRPIEIITDYEANLYYALAEVYLESNIGGSVFYYTQNLYKKVCSLNLSRDLETNSCFRNIYHMLLMLPLLPVNTILDGLNNIELEARHMNISDLTRALFDHIRTQWIINVTPDLFCVHKLENRINENVIAPFKKLRDFLLTKGKMQKMQVTIIHVIEKIIELEGFLRGTYSKPDKKSFGRDLSSFQKKNVLRAWQYIEDHPKIEINNFFSKVLGYIKCMENQLWIWGFYRYDGDTDDILINASHFSIVGPPEETEEDTPEEVISLEEDTVVMEAVIDQDGVLQTSDNVEGTSSESADSSKHFENAFLKYVYQE